VNQTIPFIEEIFSQLGAAADTRILAEIHEGEITGVTGIELLELVRKARTFIASKHLQKGDGIFVEGRLQVRQYDSKQNGKEVRGSRSYKLDRMNNDSGYTKDNCVVCCWKCNQSKGNRYTYEEWYGMTAYFREKTVL